MRYFEDFKAGDTVELGSHTVSEDEIITFAKQFDPQPFHVDKNKARNSMFGGIIASGWHTASLYMRLLVDNLLFDSASVASPGLDELRWLKPVFPGDTLNARITFVETKPSQSKPELGIIRSKGEMINGQGEVVMTVTAVNFFTRKPVQ